MSERARELLQQAQDEARRARMAVEDNLVGCFRAWVGRLDHEQLSYLNSYLTLSELDQRLPTRPS